MGLLNEVRRKFHDERMQMQSLHLRTGLRLHGFQLPLCPLLPVRSVLQVQMRLREVSR